MLLLGSKFLEYLELRHLLTAHCCCSMQDVPAVNVAIAIPRHLSMNGVCFSSAIAQFWEGAIGSQF
jgi:hypothetical protein